jgi:nucleotide-binding universal stress UspA family protein
MEHVSGRTLADLLAQCDCLEEGEALAIAAKLSAAVVHLHERGVVHYDIKSANVMLCPDGGIRLIDFGLAHLAVSSRFTLTRPLPAIASSGYAAPEQIRRKPGREGVDISFVMLGAYGIVVNQLGRESPGCRASRWVGNHGFPGRSWRRDSQDSRVLGDLQPASCVWIADCRRLGGPGRPKGRKTVTSRGTADAPAEGQGDIIMTNDILVCLEGSASTETATRTAIEIAREQRKSLVGMAIVDEPDIVAGQPGSVGASAYKHRRDEILLADARQHANAWIDRFETHCREAGVPARTIEAVGRPAERIIEEAERHDVTIIGRDANFRFETEAWDPASRAKILRRANSLIMLVPEVESEAPACLGKTVLVAYDGGISAQHALDNFVRGGLAEGRELHVATVGDNGEKAWNVANAAVERLGGAGIKAFTHNIVSVLPTSDAIMELGCRLGAGMLVMGAFARSRLTEIFRGSGTLDIITRSQTPLCLQH